MRTTPFAGLTALASSESPFVDGAAVFSRNPDLIDYFSQLGAVTHRHDAHPALPAPDPAPDAEVLTSGGNVGAGVDIFLGYTLLDSDGGETLMSGVTTLSTPPPMQPPTTPMTGQVSYASGAMMADTYYYAITFTDGLGGETAIGPVFSIDRMPGHANGSVTLFDLDADMADAGANGWRLYKAVGGEVLGFLEEGGGSTYVDDGEGCINCGQPPPAANRTNASNSFTVNVGSAGYLGTASAAVGFRVYASTDGTFTGNALLGEYPSSSAGTTITYPSLQLLEGRPPDVATAIRGARLISAGEIADLYWRAPVADIAGLPDAGRIGEVRMVLDTQHLYASWPDLGTVGGAGWTDITGTGGGGGGGHAIEDHEVAVIPRANLNFDGDVTLTDSPADDRTTVTIVGVPGPQGPSGQAAGKTFYYAPSDPSDIAGYKTLLESPSAGPETTLATPCTAVSGDTLIATFVTNPGSPGTVDYPAGTGYRRIYAMVSAGTARLHLQVFKRDAAGVEVLVRDEYSEDFEDRVPIPQEWATAASAAGALIATDRIVTKLYAQRILGPTTVTVTTFYEGTAHVSQIQTTISAGAQGPQGPPGPIGPRGPAGPAGSGSVGSGSVGGGLSTRQFVAITAPAVASGGAHASASASIAPTYQVLQVEMTGGNGRLRLYGLEAGRDFDVDRLPGLAPDPSALVMLDVQFDGADESLWLLPPVVGYTFDAVSTVFCTITNNDVTVRDMACSVTAVPLEAPL